MNNAAGLFLDKRKAFDVVNQKTFNGNKKHCRLLEKACDW